MATLDVLTAAEARDATKIVGAESDERLFRLNTAVSVRLDALCGPIVARSITESHDGGRRSVIPWNAPVSSWTSVTEYQGTTAQVLTAETAGTEPANGYLWDPVRALLYRRSGGYDYRFWAGRQNIVLVYSAGRAATTVLVPERFKEAAAIIVGHVWRTENGSGNQTFGSDQPSGFSSFAVPNRAMELIAQDRRIPGIA